jgi:hypothetical protein
MWRRAVFPLQVDPSKIIFTPYDASHEYATFKA